MSAQRIALTSRQLSIAVAEAGDAPLDIYVGGVPGLSLRRLAVTASWTLRGRVQGSSTVRTWTLGEWSSLSLDAARALAGGAMDRAKRGENPAPWIQAMTGRADQTERLAERLAPARTWTWEHGVSEYLRLGGASWRAATARHYRACLLHPAVVRAFPNLRACTPDALQATYNGFIDDRKNVQAGAVIVACRAFLRWCSTRPESGYPASDHAQLSAMRFRQAQSKDRPGVEQVSTLPTYEQVGGFLWRLGDARCTVHMRLGLALLMLTGQRISSLMMADAGEMTREAWSIPGAHMKSGRPQMLPLPEYVADVGQALVRASPPGAKLFPQVRARRLGGAVDGYMSYASFNDPCRHALGHSPHAIRRALTTYCENNLRQRRIDVQAVLDHEEASVVARDYNVGDNYDGKATVLSAWAAFVIARTRACAPAGQSWPRYLPTAQ